MHKEGPKGRLEMVSRGNLAQNVPSRLEIVSKEPTWVCKEGPKDRLEMVSREPTKERID